VFPNGQIHKSKVMTLARLLIIALAIS